MVPVHRLPGLVDDYLSGKLTVDDYVTHRVRSPSFAPLRSNARN
jgi:Zn-dependent alcohol dehydrogenase